MVTVLNFQASVIRSMKFNSDGKTIFCGLHKSLKVHIQLIYQDPHFILQEIIVEQRSLCFCL